MFSRQVVAFSVLCCSLAAASTINFTSSKASYVPGQVNEEVELTCEVAESTVQSENIKQVVSIVIKKLNGGSEQFVASVTDISAAKVAADQQNVEVYGDVSGTSGKKSYLRLKWTLTTLALAGKYGCFISVLKESDVQDELSTELSIVAKDPTIKERSIVANDPTIKERSIFSNDPTIKDVISMVQALETSNQELANEINRVKQQVNQEKTKSQDWANKVAINVGVLAELKKIQSGKHDCGNSGYRYGSFWKTKDVKIYFTHAYKRIPSVHVSLSWINDDADDEDNEFGVELGDVTQSYFIMRCKSWKKNTNHNLVGTWISAPRF